VNRDTETLLGGLALATLLWYVTRTPERVEATVRVLDSLGKKKTLEAEAQP
jgi:hypothetical protein